MKRKSLIQLKKRTIKHYNKMLEEANKFPQKGMPNYLELSEDWGSNTCPFCNEFKAYNCFNDSCYRCPLCGTDKLKLDPSYYCCNGLWEKMDNARTWKTWKKYAQLIIEMVEKLTDYITE